jgi:hypothetical protein
MKIPANTPTRSRTIQGDAYKAAGMEDFEFDIPRPFTAEMFTHLHEELAIDPVGFANTANQVLAENLGNNMAQKIRAIVKRNEEASDEDQESLPDQSDMDDLIENYDFSGIRASGAGGVSASPLEKALFHYARQQVRNILRQNGYGKLDLPAPVTVAKKDEDPKAGQISFSTFEAEVEELALGYDKWGEDENYRAFREEYVVQPAEAKVAADEKASQSVAQKLGLFS